jgi:hypothetical protein
MHRPVDHVHLFPPGSDLGQLLGNGWKAARAQSVIRVGAMSASKIQRKSWTEKGKGMDDNDKHGTLLGQGKPKVQRHSPCESFAAWHMLAQ